MLAARMTSAQRSVSVLIRRARSAGVPPIGCMLMAAKWACTSGMARTSLMAVLSLATIAADVFGGAAMAFQVSDLNSGTPASMKVGTSGICDMRTGDRQYLGPATFVELEGRSHFQ